MAYLDETQRALAIRIAYVGRPAAGKTKNFQQIERMLPRRRRSPLFFFKETVGAEEIDVEWLQFEGSPEHGLSTTFQLVTAPLTAGLLAQPNNALWGQSDILVLVCDSRPEELALTAPLLAQLRALPPLNLGAPLLVQANKQDLPGALPPKDALRALGLPREARIFSAEAEHGEGIQETLLSAVRVARDLTLRALVPGAEPGPTLHIQRGEIPSPTSLVESLRALAHVAQPEPVLPSANPEERYAWPPQEGLELLRAVPLSEAKALSREGADGKSSTLLFRAGDYCLKTTTRRRFANREEGIAALARLARTKASLGALGVPHTALYLQFDGKGAYWLWTITPWLRSLQDKLKAAEQARDEGMLGTVLGQFAEAAVGAMRVAVRDGIALDVHPSNFCEEGGSLRYLDDEIEMKGQVLSIGYSLLLRVEEYAAYPAAVGAYLEELERRLESDLSRTEVARLALLGAISQTPISSAAARAARDRLWRLLVRRLGGA
jgi:hypothetical protein